jgi:HEAT repeat protein
MVWKKVILAIVLLSPVALAGAVTQQFLSHSGLSLQQNTKARQQASDLIALLLDDNVEVRDRAFKELQALGIDASVPALVQALQERDWQIRAIAAYTLGRLGTEANPAISNLSRAIQDENADVRFAVAQAIGNIGSKKAVPALIQALQDKDENVRVSGATALSKLGAKAKPASSALTKALWDDNWFVRRQSSKALSVLGLDAVDIPLMVDPLEEIQQTRDGGIISLMTAIDPSVLDRPESMSQFFIKAMQNQDLKVRQSAASALGQIRATRFADFGKQESTEALLLALKDRDVKVRLSAIKALEIAPNKQNTNSYNSKEIAEIRSALLTTIDSDKNTQIRASSLKALETTLFSDFGVPQQLVAKQIVSVSMEALKDEDVQVRHNSINLLNKIARSDFSPSFKAELELLIYPVLVNALYDKDESVRQEALNSLSSYKSEIEIVIVANLIYIIGNKNIDKEIRRSILASIRSVTELTKSEQGVNSLHKALQDADFGIQQNTFLALQRSGLLNEQGTMNFLSALSKGLLSNDDVIKLDAINGLSEFIRYKPLNEFNKEVSSAIQSQLPSLKVCLQSPMRSIRYAAALTINKIEPSQESTIPVLREFLAEETNDNFRVYHGFNTLVKIGSPEAAFAIAENAKLENQELKYVRACTVGSIPIPSKHKALLVELLKDSSVRQILAESLYESPESENRVALVDALISLLKKEAIKPALQPVFELKNQDIRRSSVYALGEFLSSNKEHGATDKKILEALAAVVNDSNDNLDVRWMAATSLQKASINMDKFFTNNNLVNPKTVQCPYPNSGGFRGLGGLRFDPYEQRCIYDNRIGCGDGPTTIFAALRRLLIGDIGNTSRNRNPNNKNNKANNKSDSIKK